MGGARPPKGGVKQRAPLVGDVNQVTHHPPPTHLVVDCQAKAVRFSAWFKHDRQSVVGVIRVHHANGERLVEVDFEAGHLRGVWDHAVAERSLHSVAGVAAGGRHAVDGHVVWAGADCPLGHGCDGERKCQQGPDHHGTVGCTHKDRGGGEAGGGQVKGQGVGVGWGKGGRWGRVRVRVCVGGWVGGHGRVCVWGGGRVRVCGHGGAGVCEGGGAWAWCVRVCGGGCVWMGWGIVRRGDPTHLWFPCTLIWTRSRPTSSWVSSPWQRHLLSSRLPF